MNADAVDKIKKLLRTAKDRAGTPEGDAATYIANKLMDKHGIHVNSDDHKVIIENDGAHWRAQVLTATAKSQGCRVYRYKEGRQLAVVGDQADVSRSIDMFMLLVPKSMLLAASSFLPPPPPPPPPPKVNRFTYLDFE